ncbi:MAG: YggS family pyridoxal phosphate-dependent enzyme [Betaproteobacteria bacterium]|nr:YggS family pyridoxal phosphate-dependent enzyme [Betaproteobacteria bacterium]
MSPIESNLQHVKGIINNAIAGRHGGKTAAVTLVAVSKTKPTAVIREAFAAGQRDFGENYVQEGVAKIAELADLRPSGLIWHYLGPLQSNKARQVAQHFDWMHGIDRLKIAEALGGHRSGMAPLNVCVQVNVSGETSKSGVPPMEALALARQVMRISGLKLRGLMAIIENSPDETTQRAQFRIMHRLFDELRSDGPEIDTLSMGMSQDYRVAIEEGATLVRVGSAIFGARN